MWDGPSCFEIIFVVMPLLIGGTTGSSPRNLAIRLFDRKDGCGILQMYQHNDWFDFCYVSSFADEYLADWETSAVCKELGYGLHFTSLVYPIAVSRSDPVPAWLESDLKATHNLSKHHRILNATTRLTNIISCVGHEERLSHCIEGTIAENSTPCPYKILSGVCCWSKNDSDNVAVPNISTKIAPSIDVKHIARSYIIIPTLALMLVAFILLNIFNLDNCKYKIWTSNCYTWNWTLQMKMFQLSFGIIAIAQCWEEINEYTKRPTTTDYQINQEDWLMIPNMLICLHHRIDFTKFKHHMPEANDITQMVLEQTFMYGNTKSYYSVRNAFNIFKTVSTVDKFMNSVPLLPYTLSTTDELLDFSNRISYNCSDFVEQCFYNSEPFDCCSSANYSLTSLGVCTVLGGKRFLSVNDKYTILFYLPANRMDAGLVFLPHNDGLEIRFIDPSANEVNPGYSVVSVGFETTILLQRRAVSLLDRPDLGFPCNATPEYSHSKCEARCTDIGAQICNCTTVEHLMSWVDAYPDFRICNPKETDDCYDDVARTVYGGKLKLDVKGLPKDLDYMEVIAKCRTLCLTSCYFTVYEKQFSFHRLHSHRRSGIGDDASERLTGILNIGLQAMTTICFKEYHDYSEISLAAELGGIIGAWIGASFITVIYAVVVVTKYGIAIILEACKALCLRNSVAPKFPVKL